MFRILCSLAAVIVILNGCTAVGTLATVGATAGIAAAEDRGIEGNLRDGEITARINQLWFEEDTGMFRRLNLTVYDGRVLITGAVPDEDMRLEAVRLAWQPDGVKEVINEIAIGGEPDLFQSAGDVILAKGIGAKLLLDERVRAINYNIESVGGTVYLIGLAQSEYELRRVINHVRNTGGVNRVINHVKVKGPQLHTRR